MNNEDLKKKSLSLGTNDSKSAWEIRKSKMYLCINKFSVFSTHTCPHTSKSFKKYFIAAMGTA